MLVRFKVYVCITGHEELGVKLSHPFSITCIVARHGLVQSGSAWAGWWCVGSRLCAGKISQDQSRWF